MAKKPFHFHCHIAVVDKTGKVIVGQWNTRTVLHAALGETEMWYEGVAAFANAQITSTSGLT